MTVRPMRCPRVLSSVVMPYLQEPSTVVMRFRPAPSMAATPCPPAHSTRPELYEMRNDAPPRKGRGFRQKQPMNFGRLVKQILIYLFANLRQPMSTNVTYYRTRDGRADYKFSFEQQSADAWRAYIVDQPPYAGQPDDAHSTHRLSDGGRKYVCWTSPLRTLEEAKQVAAFWADKTQEYIRTGSSF